MHHISNGNHGIALFSSALNQLVSNTSTVEEMDMGLLCTLSLKQADLYPCAAGGGLFLFVDWNSGPDSPMWYLILLAKQHRVLPDFPVEHGWRAGTAVELIAETDHFKINGPLSPSKATDPTAGISCSDSHPWRSTVFTGAPCTVLIPLVVIWVAMTLPL
ncbi:hypothetical protein KI387_041676, partial [Taxus chinensis]